MFPVHVIFSKNRHLYAQEVEQHFRLRHRIFVDELGWTALEKPDAREIDQFDTKHSIYLLGIEPGRGVVAGTRLGPSLLPHLLADVFPHAAALRGVPRAPDIYDWTRIFVAPSWRSEIRPCRSAGAIKTAVLEYGLANGIRQVTGLESPAARTADRARRSPPSGLHLRYHARSPEADETHLWVRRAGARRIEARRCAASAE